jgi:hypothetical protein
MAGFGDVELTRRATKSSEGPTFSWETLLLATDRRMVGEPVDAVADMLIDLFKISSRR